MYFLSELMISFKKKKKGLYITVGLIFARFLGLN